jgi:hypothetical protein
VIPNQEITSLLKAAIECSIFISPTDPGLTYQELLEVGKRSEFLDGEVADAARHVGERLLGFGRLMPDRTARSMFAFLTREEPEYRNFGAFDFVISQLNERVRADGMGRARLERGLIVERAAAQSIPRHDIEVAITYQILAGTLTQKDGVVHFSQSTGVRELPSVTLEKMSPLNRAPRRYVSRERALPIVKDIIERRTDGRPNSVEPLDAFSEQLHRLGYGPFRMWWTQTVLELRQSDVHRAPVSVSVLAAALVEGALTFVVKHARKFGAFQSADFDKDTKTWKIDDLVKSAASGGASAILDLQTKNRAESLIRTRQRIHAGRMLSEFPAGVPEIRPEEGRDAKATADQVVRRVLDWLQAYPPT